MGKVKDDNYYITYGWMINQLQLKGNELQIFAIIYGFSQSKQKNFSGSISYLADWIGGRRATATDVLNKLIKKNLVIKETNYNGIPNVYKINPKIFNEDGLVKINLNGNSTGTCTDLVQEVNGNSTGTCTDLVHNNNINNNIDNNINNIAAAKEKHQRFLDDDFKEIVDLFSNNIHLINGEVEGNKLADYLNTYGKNWVLEAIKEAALCHGRSVNYIGKILMRWEKEGFKNGTGSEKKSAPMVRQGKTTGYKRLHSAYKAETTEEARRKFANEKSGWD